MDISGWTFKNIIFEGRNGLTFANGAKSANITIEDCSFNGANLSSMLDQGGSITGVTVKNCYFVDIKEGSPAILLQNATDVTIDGCTFLNAGYNAAQITRTKGTIAITNNKVDGTTDRTFRISNTSATQITVTGNVAVNSGDAAGEVFKIGGYQAGTTNVTVSGNTWDGLTDAELRDLTSGTDYVLSK